MRVAALASGVVNFTVVIYENDMFSIENEMEERCNR
jgi:hypothetical protein